MRTSVLVLVGVTVGLLSGSSAWAQSRTWDQHGFINVNGGYQATSHEFTEAVQFTIYEEQASFSGPHAVDAGPIFDISAGARVWRNLALGVGVTRFANKVDVSLPGTVPHPLYFDRPRSATATATGAQRQEVGIHIQATWVVPVSDKVQVAISAGPTVFSVKQDVVSAVTVSEGSIPFNSVREARANLSGKSKSAVGFNVGGDLAVMITKMVGVGAFARYAAAKLDVAAQGAETVSLDVGGFQLGGGLRLRF